MAKRFATPGVESGHSPVIHSAPNPRKRTIAITLIDENQYSNSPNDRADTMLVAVSMTISVRLRSHSGTVGS